MTRHLTILSNDVGTIISVYDGHYDLAELAATVAFCRKCNFGKWGSEVWAHEVAIDDNVRPPMAGASISMTGAKVLVSEAA